MSADGNASGTGNPSREDKSNKSGSSGDSGAQSVPKTAFKANTLVKWKKLALSPGVVGGAGARSPGPRTPSLLQAAAKLTHQVSDVFSSPEGFTGPCSQNDSGYIGKLEISKIKKPSCFVRLIPSYIGQSLRVLLAESWKNLTFPPFAQFSHTC